MRKSGSLKFAAARLISGLILIPDYKLNQKRRPDLLLVNRVSFAESCAPGELRVSG